VQQRIARPDIAETILGGITELDGNIVSADRLMATQPGALAR